MQLKSVIFLYYLVRVVIMVLELERINKSALDYALKCIPRMQQIAQPLETYLGIKSFSYMRTYDDCTYLSLLNGYEEYTKKFFQTIPSSDPHFIKAIQNTPYDEPSYCLWPTAVDELTPIMSLLDYYDIWHGFQISFRRANYCEMFSFTFNKSSDDKSSFYLKNIPKLLKFINYFKSQALDIIETENKKVLAVFPEKFSIDYVQDPSLDFFTQALTNNSKPILIKDSFGDIAHLTPRESQCLSILIKNKTSKEIARILNIAPRTAELHIQNIKTKLKVNFKNELFDICKENLIFT